MPDLLIAVPSSSLSEALANAITDYRVHICHTGPEALAQIERLRPDALLIGLSLPIIDGLSVLRLSAYTPPVVIGLTNIVSPAIVASAQKLGVQRISVIPCKASHIRELLNDIRPKETPSLGI